MTIPKETVQSITRVRWQDDSLAADYRNSVAHFHRRGKTLTPASPDREIVREHIPLHASQNLISWSYEPVTRMTDICVFEGVSSLVSKG